MKAAIYVEDGLRQVVLVAQTSADKAVLELIEGAGNLRIKRGSFFVCRGDWVRYQMATPDDDSLMIVCEDAPE